MKQRRGGIKVNSILTFKIRWFNAFEINGCILVGSGARIASHLVGSAQTAGCLAAA